MLIFFIFRSLRFYVKSILGCIEVQNLLFPTHLEAVNFDFDEFLHYLNAEIYKINNIQKS